MAKRAYVIKNPDLNVRSRTLAVSGLFAVVLIDLALPIFNSLTGKEINISYFHDLELTGMFLLVLLLVGLLAGLYPALFLSSYKPMQTRKGTLREKASGVTLRKGLVIFQSTISIVMIVATAIAYHQLQYIQTKDLGYAKELIMVILLNNEARDRYTALRDELLKNSHILNTTTSSLVPTMGSSHNTFQISGTDEPLYLAQYLIDKNFMNTYGIKVLAGKDMTRDLMLTKKAEIF